MAIVHGPLLALITLLFLTGCAPTAITIQRYETDDGAPLPSGKRPILELDAAQLRGKSIVVNVFDDTSFSVSKVRVNTDSTYFLGEGWPEDTVIATKHVETVVVRPGKNLPGTVLGTLLTLGGFVLMGLGADEEENLLLGLMLFYSGASAAGTGLGALTLMEISRTRRTITYIINPARER